MRNLARLCLDWRVLTALAATGVIVWLISPGLVGRVAPVLFLVACPLSMLLMSLAMGRGMKGMRGMGTAADEGPAAPAADTDRRERLAQLRAQLSQSELERAATVREIAALEGIEAADTRAVTRK